MNARALLISLPTDFHSSPKHNFPPDFSVSRKISCSESLFRLRFLPADRAGNRRVSTPFSDGSVRRRVGRVWAEVRSDSAPKAVKLEDALGDVVFKREGDDVDGELESAVPWWKEFPKRWVIVVLCFSAFLLCNMDRVSFYLIT